MRLLYLGLGYCLAPLLLLAAAWRARGGGATTVLGERLGLGAPAVPGGLWVHAVSVGEVQAAVSLVRALRERYPARPLTLTTTTSTGRERALALFGAEVSVRYLPIDLPGAVRRFLARVRPAAGIVLETELWPNLYRACRQAGVPLVLASATVSERSARRYGRIPRLVHEALAGVSVAAQSEADAARFAALGAEPARLRMIGNLKFDLALPADLATTSRALRATLGPGRAVWVAGSTHEGEEAIVLAAHAHLAGLRPAPLLVLAPRHRERFDVVAARLAAAGIPHVRRSAGRAVEPSTEVLLLDSLGELLLFYAAGDVAFVGGSLVPVGGHNLLEPAAVGRPVVTGPHTASAAPAAQLLAAAGALAVAHDAIELAAAVGRWLAPDGAGAQAGERGRAAVLANRGALNRFLEFLAPLVAGAPAATSPPPSGRASR
ncbi:MAG: lipid IV(A) 3-deoxy-D-manno-octulosonic acid transferase [Proteobacteria bacterium]|nr:lipid IV(A) 3-deoxy-D-manno-octulosonic acid transferase [Pseudomonadota bacterium]